MRKYFFIVLFMIIFFSLNALAYEPKKVHTSITSYSIVKANIIAYFKNNLNYEIKLDQTIGDFYERIEKHPLLGQIKKGSMDEDDPVLRGLFHFYDPQKGKGLFYLSIPSLNVAYDLLGKAKDNFYAFVLGENSSKRDEELQACFHKLGRICHLIEDKAVPAHVRNDPHPFFEPYELYTRKEWDQLLYNDSANNYDPVDITQFDKLSKFWDWNKGGAGESAEGVYDDNSKGLAEFTNYNFVSKDTNIGNIFDRIYRMNMMEVI